ncbi:MAG: type II toxin-antitoxin system RelE/ParE family toxin [Alphaproteobacteria bacterium]|nr:type II toxin-antitoxin system RelE/ParE family toxin [Alphaproteobacteria bacterium]
MTYKLTFLKSAKKEWNKLAPPIKEQFKNKLVTRLENPCIPKDRLTGMVDCYKIKLRASRYRLVYKVVNDRVTVQVIAVGKRDKEEVYKIAHTRLN